MHLGFFSMGNENPQFMGNRALERGRSAHLSASTTLQHSTEDQNPKQDEGTQVLPFKKDIAHSPMPCLQITWYYIGH